MLAEHVELRPYQSGSVERMVDRGSMLVAITMGGGKTVISIAAMEKMMAAGTIKRALIVVPSTLKYQWQQEIADFTNSMSLVIDGTKSQRNVLYANCHVYPYVIINYEAVVNDWKGGIRKLKFDCLIVDEATYIKSFTSKRTRAVKALAKRAKMRYGLTGQPVENRPEDLYSIMELVDDSVLGGFEKFDRTFIVRDVYGRPIRYRNLPLLNSLMRDTMIRYSREDIKDQLPDVQESVIPVTISRAEARLYNLIRDRLLAKMYELTDQYGGGFSLTANYGRDDDHAMMRAQGEVMSMLLALRLVCDDPALLLESAKHYDVRDKDENGRAIDKGVGSQFAWRLMEEGLLDTLPKSTKVSELAVLLKSILAESDDAKIVVFSTFKGMLRALQMAMGETTRAVLYTGDMNARQKNVAKLQFSRDPATRLFLSSDAGGYGVNLKEANYLVSIDLPWSTGKIEQREARIIRFSTKFDHVNLIATIVRGSVEERIYEMLKTKKGIANAFVDGQYDKLGRYDVTLSSLTKFLEEHSV